MQPYTLIKNSNIQFKIMTTKSSSDKDKEQSLAQSELEKASEKAEKDLLDKLFNSAVKADIEKVAPNEIQKKEWHSPSEINKLISELAKYKGVTNEICLIAIILLFNKGAANSGTPTTMYVTVGSEQGEFTTDITKDDLMYNYKKLFGNEYIRRLGESMSTTIGNYSQAKGLQGDLYRKINNKLVADKQPQLTAKEAAWTSSFHQNNPILNTISDRLAGILANDYTERFKSKETKKPQVTRKAADPNANKPKKGKK